MCGYLSDPYKACSRAPKCGGDYQIKISDPIMDRFDLNIEIEARQRSIIIYLIEQQKCESSLQIAYRVEKACNIQQSRYEGYNIKTNNRLDGQLLIEYALPIDKGKSLLNGNDH